MESRAGLIEKAVRTVLRDGHRTAGHCRAGEKGIGTSRTGDAVMEAVMQLRRDGV